MHSIIENKLKSRFPAIVLVRTDEKPADALQLKPGAKACMMSLFAKVVAEGKTAVFDRDTCGCAGAHAGLGFGNGYYHGLPGGVESFASFFSKGLEDLPEDPTDYQTVVAGAKGHAREKFAEGERFHTDRAKARRWITQDLPIYDFPEKYAVLKPLTELKDGEIPKSVIFTVNPIGLSGLIALNGSITEGTPAMVAPQGSGCQNIGAYVFAEGASENPRAVLGNIDLSARHTMRGVIPDDYLCYSVPWNLFLRLEEEARTGIFESPIWKVLHR